ncbi:MAG TPA: dipeptide epimerase [Ktedonobacterales bacterium]|jgi:L-alanine-DL-glutamate epimerase-like enolase superfamily enzyme|nr:dipeptide epimerase [Ktedonobacterales bacterium]
MAHLRNSPTTIVALSAEPLDVPLHEPFAIATGRITAARNALVRVRLSNGVEGIGEAAPFPPSGGETQETALAAVAGMQTLVEGYDVAQWRTLARRLTASFEHQTTARAGVEAAMLDALARSWGMPLYRYFGEATSAIETDITIPIESPEHMRDLARRYAEQGASTLKIKVGADVDDDLDRVLAVVEGAPDCDIMLDGNQGYTPSEALDLLRSLAQEDVAPILFEQPTHRHDLDGLKFVTERAGIPVAADEAVHTAADALRVARMGAANVINIKLMKSGFSEALEIAAVCRAAHIDLMVGAMMESRLGIMASLSLVAGLGGFRYIDLDTPMLLASDPFLGGYTQEGMVYHLDLTAPGMGVTLAEIDSDEDEEEEEEGEETGVGASDSTE